MHSRVKVPRKTAFVPRIIFRAAAVGSVVPLCAAHMAGCGGEVLAINDAGSDVFVGGVAAQCFDACTLPGVAEMSFDAGFFGVADVGFDGDDAYFGGFVGAFAFDGGDAFPAFASRISCAPRRRSPSRR
jgi:hypothetical protein